MLIRIMANTELSYDNLCEWNEVIKLSDDESMR